MMLPFLRGWSGSRGRRKRNNWPRFRRTCLIRQRSRHLSMEPLEERQLLSVTPALEDNDTAAFFAGDGLGELRPDGDAVRYSGLESIVDNADPANRVIGLSNDADTDATLSAASATELTLSGTTFESITFPIPTQSLTIDGLAGTDVVTIDLSIDLGSTNLTVIAENIFLTDSTEITTSGDLTLTAVAENNLTGSSSPSPIDVAARILVEGDVDLGGSLTLEATVNNTVDLDASGASLALESVSNALAQIGSNADVVAGHLTVSAVTNTNFSVDIPNATSGGSGLGETVVDGGRGNLTELWDAGPATPQTNSFPPDHLFCADRGPM